MCVGTGNLYCRGYIHTNTSVLMFGLFFFLLVCLQKFHLHHRVYGEHLWSNFCRVRPRHLKCTERSENHSNTLECTLLTAVLGGFRKRKKNHRKFNAGSVVLLCVWGGLWVIKSRTFSLVHFRQNPKFFTWKKEKIDSFSSKQPNLAKIQACLA